MEDQRLYPVYKCRLCGHLMGDLPFPETKVLATHNTAQFRGDWRKDPSIRDDVKAAQELVLIAQHVCEHSIVGLADFVGFSRRPIDGSLTASQEEA
jgi:hypothetical protein